MDSPKLQRFRSSLATLVPEGWHAREIVHLASGDLNVQVVATVDFVPPGTSVEDYVERLRALPEPLPGFEELEVEQATLRSDAPAVLRRVRWTGEGDEPVSELQLFAVVERRALHATATTLAESVPSELRELLLAMELPSASGRGGVLSQAATPRAATYGALERGELAVTRRADEAPPADWGGVRPRWAEAAERVRA